MSAKPDFLSISVAMTLIEGDCFRSAVETATQANLQLKQRCLAGGQAVLPHFHSTAGISGTSFVGRPGDPIG